jgi:hypothetical protein
MSAHNSAKNLVHISVVPETSKVKTVTASPIMGKYRPRMFSKDAIVTVHHSHSHFARRIFGRDWRIFIKTPCMIHGTLQRAARISAEETKTSHVILSSGYTEVNFIGVHDHDKPQKGTPGGTTIVSDTKGVSSHPLGGKTKSQYCNTNPSSLPRGQNPDGVLS